MTTILTGDCRDTLKTIPDGTVQCVVTSPPYWALRSYLPSGHADKHLEIGSEPTPEKYVETMVGVFREVKRVLHASGTVFLNLGCSYAGSWGNYAPGGIKGTQRERTEEGQRWEREAYSDTTRLPATANVQGFKPKDLIMMPWMVAIALQRDGWWVRSIICWHKKSCMPESVSDCPTNSWEPIFLLAKNSSYFYDAEAVRERAESLDENGNHKWTGRPASEMGRPQHHELREQDPSKRHLGLAEVKGAAGLRSCGYSEGGMRNQRNVWSLGPEPFSGSTETVVWNRVREGALSGGMRRIALPDSQFDGGLFDLLATVLDDAHADVSLPHIVDICPHLSLKPAPGFVPFETLRVYKIGDESLDSLLLNSWPSAISRSNESHKTDLFVSTMIACMPSAERTARIARILTQRGLSVLYLDSLVNNTWPDEMDARSWEGTLCRSGDIVSFSCEPIYRKAVKMQSHFATFPSEIPRRAILAGTSARGCCPKCFAPWVRVVERGDIERHPQAGNYQPARMSATAAGQGTNGEGKSSLAMMRSTRTVGWEPGCGCEKDPMFQDTVPCTVLDPFGGSGTVGMVATELGRKSILCELNPEYVKLAETRTNVTPGFTLA